MRARRLRRAPDWIARRDALSGAPARQAARSAAVAAILGTLADASRDVQHNRGRARFQRPAFVAYLRFR